MDASESRYKDWLDARRRAGLSRELTHVVPHAPGAVTFGGRQYVNFSGNDYLGLSRHPLLIERAREWAERYGAGAGASRLVTGNLELFEGIERRIAAFKQMPAALVMASGFQTNAAVLQALLDKQVLGAEPLVFADRLNHASMHFGCQAAGVRQHRYRHCDTDHLEKLLEKHDDDGRPKFILTESVFSMDGDVAPMDELAALAARHGATLVCDDAHATGVLGAGGKGLSEGAHVVIGTFSKAMGGYGAYVACSDTVRDYLINHCSGLIYSTALPPAVLGAIDASLELVGELDDERARVADIAAAFRARARERHYDTGASETQIVPLIVGEADSALDLSRELADAGYWATAIRPPTVPKGTARLRLAFSAAHQDMHIEGLLDVLATTTKQKSLATA
ncbi:MAG: 8-amino-7-oxononanoate synthase [Hyphomicrobiaceae bacterium]|nr:8-amino-7-oxononanoate synthase [Hyphomicrobiaceae bacterium]